MKNGKGMGSGVGFRVGIGNGVGSGCRSRGGAGDEGVGEKHIQWGERIKWSGMKRRVCRPLKMIGQAGGLLSKNKIVK